MIHRKISKRIAAINSMNTNISEIAKNIKKSLTMMNHPDIQNSQTNKKEQPK